MPASDTGSTLRPIGNVESVCPYCGQPLARRPGAKSKCPHCGQFIHVRTRPIDGQRVLATKAQVEEIEEQWYIFHGDHEAYLTKRRRFEGAKKALTRDGKEPSDGLVNYHLLNRDQMRYAREKHWGSYRNAHLDMAEILRRESDPRNSLARYMEVCYLDLNGPSNMGPDSYVDPNGRRVRLSPDGTLPWDPKRWGSLAPALVGRVARLLEQTATSREEAELIFVRGAETLGAALRLPVSPHDAWVVLSAELYADPAQP